MDTVSARRLWLLFRSDAIAVSRTVVSVCALFMGVVIVANFLMPDVESLREYFYIFWFAIALFLWGTISTSRAFRDLHDRSRNEAYLLLPASAAEKTLSRLVGLTVVFATFVAILTFSTSLLVEAVNALQGRAPNAIFNPLSGDVWQVMPQYFVLQSYYFLGAAWFRRLHFVKTTLAIGLAFTALFVVVFASVRIALGPYWWNNIGSALNAVDLAFRPLVGTLLLGAQLVHFVVVPGLCWYTAYLRVRETQVSDGV